MSEKLLFHSIAAGPNLQAQPGQTVQVDDPKLAKALKMGQFAEALGAPASAPAAPPAGSELRSDGPTIAEFIAAGYDPNNYPPAGYASRNTPEEIAAAIAQADADKLAKAKSPESVQAALMQLDPRNDEDWTAAGKPSMARIEAIIGTKDITRAEVDAMFPDFRRPSETPPSNDGEQPETPPSNDGTQPETPPSGRAARSNL